MNVFDYTLYNKLLLEDREIIQEYSKRLSSEELNSFMHRLVDYYKTSDTIEINEDADAILVFEQSRIAKYKSVLGKEIKKYFNQYFFKTTNNIAKLCLLIAIRKYFDEQEVVKEWKFDTAVKKRVREIYLDLIPSHYVRNIVETRAPIKLYIYRINKTLKKSLRLGIAIDKSILPATETLAAGFGKNYKLDIKNITYKGIDITQHIKRCSYWSAQNAQLCGFDDKTGIIWFNGNQEDDKWRLPNDIIVDNNSEVILNAVSTTDAFAKMLYRFNLDKKITKIMLDIQHDLNQ